MKRPKCPDEFDVDFGRKLVEYLGGDPALIIDWWCWEESRLDFEVLKNKNLLKKEKYNILKINKILSTKMYNI